MLLSFCHMRSGWSPLSVRSSFLCCILSGVRLVQSAGCPSLLAGDGLSDIKILSFWLLWTTAVGCVTIHLAAVSEYGHIIMAMVTAVTTVTAVAVAVTVMV